MSQSVMIKSNKYGINLVLDPNIPFVELLKMLLRSSRHRKNSLKMLN